MERITGENTAHTITEDVAVEWILESDGTVFANGIQAGRIIESLPGRLYYAYPSNGRDWFADFATASAAAAALAALQIR